MSTKNNRSNKDLREYRKNPEDFFNSIEEDYDYVTRVMDLIELTNSDPELIKNISLFCFPDDPLDIFTSSHSVDTRLCLLNATYIYGEVGYTDLTKFYKELIGFNAYGLSLEFHCSLASKILSSLISRIGVFYEFWIHLRLLELTPLYNNISEHTNEISIPVLASMLPMYHLLQSLPSWKDNGLGESIALIMNALYGDRTEQIIAAGTALGVTNNPDYWLSCVEMDKAILVGCSLPEIC